MAGDIICIFENAYDQMALFESASLLGQERPENLSQRVGLGNPLGKNKKTGERGRVTSLTKNPEV